MNRSIKNITPILTLPGLCISSVLVFTSITAHATLGLDAASVKKDQAALGATLKITKSDGYTDYMLTLPDNGVVHELVSPAGKVFEITWLKRGSWPQMGPLWGDYANRFSGSVHGTSPTSRHADRVDDDFEMHARAVNRIFSGTAHVPALLPQNLSGPIAVPNEKMK